MRKSIVLIGGGGHCKAVIDVIEAEGKFEIVGIIDQKEKVGQYLFDYPIIGSDEDIVDAIDKYTHSLVTIGQVHSPERRIKVFTLLQQASAVLPVVISPAAVVSKRSAIGAGSIIMHHATVNSGASIGSNCIINTSSIIEHDAIVGDHCHISTGAIVNGNCEVKCNSFIGSNAVLKQGVSVGENCLIGAGTVLLASARANSKYVGNPARKISL